MKKLLHTSKRVSILCLAVFGLLGFAILWPGGAPQAMSGHGGTGDTCADGCHSGTATSNLSVFTIENVTPSEFTPGGTISFDVVFKSPGSGAYGFEVSVGDPGNHVGTLINTGTNTEFADSNPLYVTHSNNNETTWNVEWTAPSSSPPNSVTIWAAGLDKDNGVQTYTASLVVNQAALPVELTWFDVRLDGQTAILDWRTESETNNIGFDIQHAEDTDTFEVLGFVQGAYTTSEAHDYSYTVSGLLPGSHRFRLRQIDLDGTTTVSEQIEVAVSVPDRFFLSDAYPNPFNPTTTFEFAVRQDQEVRVRVYDEMGRQVSDLFNGTLSANETHRVTFDAAGLASGTYIVQLQGADFSESRQVVLLK